MPRPRSYRSPAIILKRRDMGEADRLVTLFTPFHGKVNALARGARKATGSKTGHVELYTRADVLITAGKDLDTLTQVEMVEAFLPLREELTRSACASYVAELLDRFTYSGETDDAELFTLLDATLRRLCSADDAGLVLRFYELALLDAVGFRPELQECVITHEPLLPVDQFFSYADGGVVSPEGARHTGALTPLTLPALKLLRHVQRTPYPRLVGLKVSPAAHQEAERLMHGYVRFLLEQAPRSVDFLRRVRRQE
ncbi:MAG: DNA repair protein RecO [Anaerolineae bacterium]|nr:DNA repair protein RecO [Anaerolineae bacterium]